MKGVIFSELIRWVEEAFSPAIADEMITRAQLPNDGSYTSVGSYPHEQALAMIAQLVQITGRSEGDLSETYGYWLAPRFAELYPRMFDGYNDSISFMRGVNNIHTREVIKLYPDARTPSVIAAFEGDELTVSYDSHRPLADVAFGLIRGYIDYFGDKLVVERNDEIKGPFTARFMIRRN